ncbi:MAG: hypothetical protein AAFX80_24480, partial [Cyanobacteria bacterium J06639_18]
RYYVDFKFYLEDLLRVSVDWVTKKMLRSEIRETLEREAVALSFTSMIFCQAATRSFAIPKDYHLRILSLTNEHLTSDWSGI